MVSYETYACILNEQLTVKLARRARIRRLLNLLRLIHELEVDNIPNWAENKRDITVRANSNNTYVCSS